MSSPLTPVLTILSYRSHQHCQARVAECRCSRNANLSHGASVSSCSTPRQASGVSVLACSRLSYIQWRAAPHRCRDMHGSRVTHVTLVIGMTGDTASACRVCDTSHPLACPPAAQASGTLHRAGQNQGHQATPRQGSSGSSGWRRPWWHRRPVHQVGGPLQLPREANVSSQASTPGTGTRPGAGSRLRSLLRVGVTSSRSDQRREEGQIPSAAFLQEETARVFRQAIHRMMAVRDLGGLSPARMRQILGEDASTLWPVNPLGS